MIEALNSIFLAMLKAALGLLTLLLCYLLVILPTLLIISRLKAFTKLPGKIFSYLIWAICILISSATLFYSDISWLGTPPEDSGIIQRMLFHWEIIFFCYLFIVAIAANFDDATQKSSEKGNLGGELNDFSNSTIEELQKKESNISQDLGPPDIF